MAESVIYEKTLNMKTMTLHEILLLNHSIVLRFDETIRTAYIWNYGASPCAHCRNAKREKLYDRWKYDRPQHLSQ